MHFWVSVWDYINLTFLLCFVCVCCSNANQRNEHVHMLQLQQFSERRVAFSDRIAKVPIFFAMTVQPETFPVKKDPSFQSWNILFIESP